MNRLSKSYYNNSMQDICPGDLDIYKTAPIYLLISKSANKTWCSDMIYLAVSVSKKEIYFVT